MPGRMAPLGVESVGRLALKFHIPDGKYRQQVFALEEGNGMISVYLPDVSAAAVSKKIIDGPRLTEKPTRFRAPPRTIIRRVDFLRTCKGAAELLQADADGAEAPGRRRSRPSRMRRSSVQVERLCELKREGWAAANRLFRKRHQRPRSDRFQSNPLR